MKKIFTKTLYIGLLISSIYQSSHSMGLLTRFNRKNTIESIYTKTSNTRSLPKNTSRNIHIFTLKNTNTPLPDEFHKRAYTASLEHEFPTAPFYNKNYDASQCETKKIKEKLASQEPKIDVHWIPRTLYELFVLQHYYDNAVLAQGYSGNLENDNLQLLLHINNHQKNITLHKEINADIVEFLSKHPKQKDTADNDYFIQLAEKLLNKFPTEIINLKIPVLNAIFYETEVHNKAADTFILYRSGKLETSDFSTVANYALNDTSKQHSQLPEQVSLSFGLGFFAAYFTDSTACTAHLYAKKPLLQVYVLPTKKNEPMNKESAFFVPPLAPLPNFFSSGEAFHARTRTPLTSYEQKNKIKPHGWHSIEAPFPKILTIEHDHSYLPGKNRATKNAYYKDLYRSIITKAVPLNQTTSRIIEQVKKCLPEE